jgi:BirA family biotin operon repressor/biotin-[acetyl-CoA-carboxylase] ligase
MKEQILSILNAECPWRDTLHWYDTIDSTNTEAKRLAKDGAPHGTVLIAGLQTGGRGRMGRTFQSPAGQGVYLSVILRPNCKPVQLMHLTCAAGVAMMEAVETVSGIRPQMKWINDLVIGRKKLGGILTEMSVDKGMVDYAVVGIGINCLQSMEDFPPEIADLATSLALSAGQQIAPAMLAAAMVEALWKMNAVLLSEKAQLMATYKENCITLGKEIQVIRQDEIRLGKALDLDSDGGLLVQYEDGTTEMVSSGEVSVRGMYGYL